MRSRDTYYDRYSSTESKRFLAIGVIVPIATAFLDFFVVGCLSRYILCGCGGGEKGCRDDSDGDADRDGDST